MDINNRSWLRNLQVGVGDAVLTLGGLASLTMGLYALYEKDETLAAVGIGAGVLLLFAATLHRFEFLKGFGIEAKVRELDKTIDKAEVALSSLVGLTRSVIALTPKIGRMSGAPTIDESHNLATHTHRVLSAAGATPSEIRETLLPWAQMEAWDMAAVALKPVNEKLDGVLADLREQQRGFRSPISPEVRPAYESVIARVRLIDSYQRTGRETLRTGPLPDLSQGVKDYVLNAPELDQEQKLSLIERMEPFLVQIEHLNRDLAFQDIQFWRQHVRNYK